MNLVFHLIAAGALVALVIQLIRVQKDREFLRLLLKVTAKDKAASSKIIVEWPLKYLDDFSRCLGIAMDGTGRLDAGEPRKMDTKRIIELYLNQGILSISYKAGSGGKSRSLRFQETEVTFLLGKSSDGAQNDVQYLEDALKIKCHVTYEKKVSENLTAINPRGE
jgi:hypothetical protein